MAPISCILLSLFFLIAASIAEVVDLRSAPGRSQALVERSKPPTEYNRLPSHPDDDLELLDIVLVSSVDGKFHALNRTSGQTLWSMSTATSKAAPSALAPLVRTVHVDHDPDLTDETTPQELYVIEPQSGDIYVMATPTSPLQRFPFSMTELVDMSPFTFAEHKDRRLFVGRKETSLLLIELETGKIKATLNSECAWDAGDGNSPELDLDELDGSKPPISTPTEVYIGRTDYHISIRTSIPNNPATSQPPVQNLLFSVYGPNNKDNHLQAAYRRTKDDSYIQSLPTGEIIAFKGGDRGGTVTNSESPFLWGQSFGDPVVAVFDVLRKTSSHTHKNTFVLLQPRRPLEEMLPNFTPGAASPHSDNSKSAFVGMVKETGSLFTMTPEHFPLVAFRGADTSRLIDASDVDLPLGVDDITKMRQFKKERMAALELCDGDGMYTDRRCLIGIRELKDGDGPETRMKRLLDAPKNTGFPMVQPGRSILVTNETAGFPTGNVPTSPSLPMIGEDGGWRSHFFTANFLEAAVLPVVIGVLSLWLGVKRIREFYRNRFVPVGPAMDGTTAAVGRVVETLTGEGDPIPSLPSADTNELPPETPEPAPTPYQAPPPPVTDLDLKVLPQTIGNGNDHGAMVDGVREDSDREGDADVGDVYTPLTPGKRKTRRGKRGKKKKTGIVASGLEDEEEEKEKGNAKEETYSANLGESDPPPSSTLIINSPKPVSATTSLAVSETILGFGSHGTVVFQGSLQGRAVAVKRLLRDFVTLAAREVSILQESDDHPNVIRYYYQEAHANFLYIALELCPASLADIIESPDRDQWRDIAIAFDPKRALRQVTSGLKHLHALKLVHRDIKPQNILVSGAKPGPGGKSVYRMLISDFGLCKKLDVDQTSFLPTAHGAMAAGTVGWRAPEILRGEVKLDDVSDDNSISSRGSTGTVTSTPATPATGKPTRLTKSVDIFALGCLFYYALTNGGHPFGDRFEREVNILKNAKRLDGLEIFGEEGVEAVDLIESMLDPEASERPDTTTCLVHPFFWDPGTRLNFLQDASDRFEIMCRDPRDPYLVILEKGASGIVGNDWHLRLDKTFIENLGKFRKYDGRSVQDLLRALRNKKHHYQDLPDHVRRHLGPMPEGFLAYFTRRFPRLFLHVHSVITTSSLRTESMFRSYFDLPD